MNMIRAENLTKYYGKRPALDNVSFNIEKGEIVGLLGLNGAGKTTLMRILTGFLAPTRGDAWIAGSHVIDQSLDVRSNIGYLPELTPLYTDMTARSFHDFLGRLRGLRLNRLKNRIDDVIEVCRLEEYGDVLISKLSKGFRQRVGIAQAIIHEPEVLILDEPTGGIDPVQAAITRDLISNLKKEHTVILSTHILSEASAICQRVIIIHEGKILAEDTVVNLLSIVSESKKLRLETEGPSDDLSNHLKKIAGVIRITNEGNQYFIEFPSNLDLRAKIAETVVQHGMNLLSLEYVTMSLEDVFLKLTS